MLGVFRFRTFLIVLLALILLPASTVVAQSKDERAVRSLINRIIQASNSVDPAVVRQTIADFSATANPLYTPFGNSPASVSEYYASTEETLAGLAARTFTATTPIQVSVDRGSAWSAFGWRAEYTFKDGTRRSFNGRATLVFVRERKNWKLKHWHGSLPATLPPTAGALNAEGKKILQIERAIWEAHRNRDFAPVSGYLAGNVSFFEDSQAYRVQGKEELLRSFESWAARTELQDYQLLDPKVNVTGDTALLTYYFTQSGIADGRGFQQAGKVTAVYVQKKGAWKALHFHLSINPQPRSVDQAQSHRRR